eukprot:s1799_g1.t1
MEHPAMEDDPGPTAVDLDMLCAQHGFQQALHDFISGEFAKQAELLQELIGEVRQTAVRQDQLKSNVSSRPMSSGSTALQTPKSPEGQNERHVQIPMDASFEVNERRSNENRVSLNSKSSMPTKIPNSANSANSPGLRSFWSRQASAEGCGSWPTAPQAGNQRESDHITTMKKKAKESRESRMKNSSTDSMEEPTTLMRIVQSNAFTYGIMGVICINMIVLGFQVDAGSKPPYEEPEFYNTLNTIIVSVFLVELFMKFCAYKVTGFFCGPERYWNIFDLCVVGVSVFESAVEITLSLTVTEVGEADPNHLRFLRVMKIARALRGVRVMRLLRYISSLRAILFSISSTIWSLFWTLMLLQILFYCFGVLVSQIVNDYCRFKYVHDLSEGCDAVLVGFWGSVPESMLTLFLAISGGLSWNDAFLPLREVSAIAAASMILYIIITVFAVLNVVTGVFCNTAIENAKADKDIAIMKQMHKHQAQVEALRSVFSDIDCNNSKLVSVAELEEATRDLKFKSFLESMDISTKDIWTLFMSLGFMAVAPRGVRDVFPDLLVFCQSAIDSAQSDHTMVMQSILANKEAHVEKIKFLFSEIDAEDRGLITYKMFEEKVGDQAVKAYFESMDLDVWDAWSFFKLLDLDAGGAVEIEEFLMGCLRLRGSARAIDIAKLIHDQAWLLKNQSHFWTFVEVQLQELKQQLRHLAPTAEKPQDLGALYFLRRTRALTQLRDPIHQCPANSEFEALAARRCVSCACFQTRWSRSDWSMW